MTNTRFNPVRGFESQILAQPKSNGNIYFAKDTGKIYLDISHEERILVGNSGISIFYTNETDVRENPDNELGYILTLTEIENYENCHESDLILNQADGSFYRIEYIIDEDVYCIRLSISGGGSNTGGLARKMSITAKKEKLQDAIINGQQANAIITVKSNTNDYGEPELEDIQVFWKIYLLGSTEHYKSGSFYVKHDVPYTFEYGTKLRENAESKIEFTAMDSEGNPYPKALTMRTVELVLSESTTFSKTSLHNPTVDFKLACNIKGLIDKKLIFTVDKGTDFEQKDEQILSAKTVGTIQSRAFALSHGAHTATIELYSYDNGTLGDGTKPLKFEFAYVEPGNMTPIVWLGNYKELYYSYDKIQVPYLAYDPNTPTSAAVNFYKGSALLESKSTSVDWSTGSVSFQLFEITDATIDAQNLYTILCGVTTKNIMFSCETDPNRDMTIKEDGLLVKFDAAGRSNNESSVNREIWKYEYKSAVNPENNKTYTGNFIGFNWYNNGWILDENNNTCLRISNGAQFEVPLGDLEINTSTEGKKSCAFEFEFKVKNIQNYSKVIKEITRYKATLANGQVVLDNRAYEVFINPSQTRYDNYDTFLTAMYNDTLTNLQFYMDESLSYDDLEIASVSKIQNPAVAFAKYFGTNGFCLGSQDGFFFNGADTVNVKYVEDQLINLTIVFDYDADIMMFYLNGVISSVSKITKDGLITLDGKKLVFNSSVCDIDLYKFRIYNKSLDVKDVDTNYAVDHRDVLIYDQSQVLAEPNSKLNGEYQVKFENMLQYNKDHPDDYLMPYLIIDTTNATTENGGLGAGVLPYRKSKKTNGVHATFVNTGLEYAYQNGELGLLAQAAGYLDDPNGLTAAQQYYMHHCPSWTSYWPTTDDGAISEVANANPQSKKAVNLAVQGTSSEFYPRRNYKIKLKGKDKDGEDLIYMYMNKGPFEEAYLKNPEDAQLDFFYYDNDTVGTTTFTLKVDFMESSGSYNMGFANFVKNAYTKHPLHDYNRAGAFEKKIESYEKATSYTDGTKYYVQDGKKYEKAEEQPTADTFANGDYYVQNVTYEPYTFTKLEDYRTSVQGFPVMAFHKNGDEYTFIGYYRMLLDKGSDEVYGFKPGKDITAKFLDHERVRDMTECWEFSDNSRTWCSYNDPLGRDELSFSYPDENAEGGQKLNEPETGGSGGAPYVANSFEYRYNQHEDLLDYLYAPETSGIDPEEIAGDYEDYNLKDQTDRNTLFFQIYSNWEKACKWLYSTKIENQPSQNAFTVASGVNADNFADGVYYIKTDEIQYDIATGAFDPAEYYYEKIEEENEDILDEEGNPTVTVFYEYVAGLTEEEYNNGTYYIQNTTGYKIATEFDAKETYYVADFSYQDNQYLLSEPVTYGNTTYKYDTKEYRLAKFKNEFSEHFDLEYCLVFFIMTEVFMCYDSRGKNCMMASWGPLKEGGDYVWYPIFYDIDTQLGINNTGIPSFEYYINATEEGCYSTNDSVLWMNLYRAFFPEIKAKYYAMRGAGQGIVNVHTGKTTTPLVGAASASIEENVDDLVGTVQHIDKWYLADPNECGSVAMRGQRPLIVANLDEYYKYISITNPKIGYQNRDGGLEVDGGTYFYALQGNRSLSRQQFLSNRINFIDSWLNHGEYARGGSAIFGRIGANDHRNDKGEKVYSDYWLHTDNPALWDTEVPGTELKYTNYYNEDGTKRWFLDADVTVKLAPYQSSYVAIGGDNGVSASKQYNGTPVELELPSSVVEGRLTASHYGEQLFYIYGTKSLQDIGDMSTLYWTEFYATKSPRLKTLLLGSNYPGFFNKSMNYPNFDADSNSAYGKPLLEKVNLDKIQITDTAGKFTFDFSSSEKLKHFEAIGSNITGVTFAAGVALDTLYLPKTVNNLKLVEARRLTNLISEEPMPKEVSEYLTWNPEEHKGLYIEGLTNLIGADIPNSEFSNINTYYLAGGSLGYGSYEMLDTLYKLKNTSAASSNSATSLAISLTDVNWNAYTQLVEGDIYDDVNYNYFIDDRHYKLQPYSWSDASEFEKLLIDGRLYKLKKDEDIPSIIPSIDLLINIAEKNNFSNTNSTGDTKIPIITGVMHVNNVKKYEESTIRNKLLVYYPDLKVFFNTLTDAYSANFIMIDDETGAEKLIDSQKVALDSGKTWFEKNPYTEYAGKVSKNHWVFKGWSTEPGDASKIVSQADWANQTFTDDLDYNFYAVFEHETYTVNFYDGDGQVFDSQRVIYGNFASVPSEMPKKTYSAEEEAENIFGGYVFKHYALSPNSPNPVSLTSYPITSDMNFYAVFTKIEDLRAYVNYDYFNFEKITYEEDRDWGDASYNEEGYRVTPKDDTILSGKITIPAMYKDLPVLEIGGFAKQKITHMFFETGSRLKKVSNSTFFEANAIYCDTLKYFDFIDSIRHIGESSFRKVPLEMTLYNLPKNLYYIDSRAFNASFKSAVPIVINLPASVRVINWFSIANNTNIPSSGNVINIGSAEEKSELDLNRAYDPGQASGYQLIFSDRVTEINFYTDLYTNPEDTFIYRGVERTLREGLDAKGSALQIIN